MAADLKLRTNKNLIIYIVKGTRIRVKWALVIPKRAIEPRKGTEEVKK